MFKSYDLVTVFTLSAVLSFVISATVLLILAAKRGYMRVGKPRGGKVLLLPQPQLPIPSAPPAVEMTPLTTYTA